MPDTDDITAVIERAKKAGLAVEIREVEYEDEVVTYHDIVFGSGKGTRPISVSSPKRASDLLSIEFECFSFLDDYEAIVDLKKGEIEAVIASREPYPTSLLERRLGLVPTPGSDEEDSGEEVAEFALEAERPDGVSIKLSRCSEELMVFTLAQRAASRPPLSLKISLGGERTYAAALNALETISNSLFFQLDIERDVALSLRKSIRRRRRPRLRNSRARKPLNIQFPAFEYDKAPISLYWYARSARGMPLLQYLAYYQVVEYYFTSFSKKEAIKNAIKVLKRPDFRLDRESDITKLVTSISRDGRSGIGEREQMKLAVAEIISTEEVDRFFQQNQDIAEVISKKQKGITDKTVNTSRKDFDHRADIAILLYDIRCRIVHTKNGFEGPQVEMILPYSNAEEDLWAYTELMQFVAQNALVHSSSALTSM